MTFLTRNEDINQYHEAIKKQLKVKAFKLFRSIFFFIVNWVLKIKSFLFLKWKWKLFFFFFLFILCHHIMWKILLWEWAFFTLTKSYSLCWALFPSLLHELTRANSLFPRINYSLSLMISRGEYKQIYHQKCYRF